MGLLSGSEFRFTVNSTNLTYLVITTQGPQSSLEQDLRLLLAELALLREVVEQLAAGAEFRYDPDGRLGRDDLVHLRDVRVLQLPVVVDFAGERRTRRGR